MDHIRDRGRLSIQMTVMALLIAAAATHADGGETRDCEPSAVQADTGTQPLTRDERIARLDQALYESLVRFDECQNTTSPAADQDAGAGGEAAGAGDGASGESVAAEGIQDAETPRTGEPATDGASIESVAAEGIQGTEAPDDVENTVVGTERLPDSGSGKVPDDIPEPDNDSVLESQIRRAATEETDPRIRAELWNEYRKYKGLPSKPLPEEDGESSDAQISE